MGHAAIVQAVCIEGRALQFGPDVPEGIALLAAACMARDPADRPSFEDVLEILDPLGAALCGLPLPTCEGAGGGGGRSGP
jgi:hypothetical protein